MVTDHESLRVFIRMQDEIERLHRQNIELRQMLVVLLKEGRKHTQRPLLKEGGEEE